MLGWHQFDNTPLSGMLASTLLAHVRAELPSVHKVIIADYRHGLLSPAVVKNIIELCAHHHVPLYVDSQISYGHTGNHSWYTGASLFCLNLKEAQSVDVQFDLREPKASLMRLKTILDAQHMVVKLGEKGSIALLGKEHVQTHAPAVEEVDATGAGDSFLGALALGEFPPTHEDLKRANIWAAFSVTQIGTVVPSISEYKEHLKKHRLHRH